MTPQQYLIIILLIAIAFQWFLFYLVSIRLRELEKAVGKVRALSLSEGEVDELMRNVEHVKQMKI